MRPQTAQHSRTVLFNQLSGQYYTLSDQGKEIKINKRGDLAAKYVNDFTGFINFKERKARAQNDQALMYNQPKLQHDKENGFICPTGNKFHGYAQSPYNLKGQNLDFLGGNTFKQTVITKNQSKSVKTQNPGNSGNCGLNSPVGLGRSVNKFKSLKLFRKTNGSELNFELIRDKLEHNLSQEDWKNTLSSKISKGDQFEKSIVLNAAQKYSTLNHKRIKSTNTSSAPSLHRTPKLHNSIHQHKTYFEQSLSNIQRTETPNFLHSDMTYSEILPSGFNQSSVKSKCYKNSCHYAQYKPKRRYIKSRRADNTVNIEEYRVKLQGEMKEKDLLGRLKQQLKVYQPIEEEVSVKREEEKKPQEKGKKGNEKK